MANLKLTGGDLTFDTTGNLVFVDGDEEIAQMLQVNLKFFRGEWELDPDAGTPYYPRILGAKPLNLALIESIMRESILTSPGVEEITKFELDYTEATRRLSLDFAVRAQSGNIIEFPSYVVLGV
jgi:hypothetical protein